MNSRVGGCTESELKVSVSVCVRQSLAVCGSARQCVAVCGMAVFMAVCLAVCQRIKEGLELYQRICLMNDRICLMNGRVGGCTESVPKSVRR